VVFLQDLRGMQAQLRTEKLAAMGRMSAAVAHEIRNPLAAISQANALLAEELAEPAQQRLTDMIRQNARRLARIVDDVLDVARAPGLADDRGPGAERRDRGCAEWAAQHGAGARLELHCWRPS
jgi:two-component system sensor histidine kinase PilS (NtrC family)